MPATSFGRMARRFCPAPEGFSAGRQTPDAGRQNQTCRWQGLLLHNKPFYNAAVGEAGRRSAQPATFFGRADVQRLAKVYTVWPRRAKRSLV